MKLFSRGKQKSGKPIGKNASGKSSTKPNAKPTPKASSKPAAKSVSKPTQATNQWRNEPGVTDPLRVGRGIRTRDDAFMGQKNKVIHPEQPKEELYRRTATVKISESNKLALVEIKRPNSKNGIAVPNDTQNRKYIPDVLTHDKNDQPIKLRKGAFELAPVSENVTEEQAKKILAECEKTKRNKERLDAMNKLKKKT